MATEIAEQPEVIARTLDVLLPRRAELRRLVSGRRQLLFVGRGSSDHACVYGRYLLEIHAGWGAALGAPSLATHYAVDRDLSDTVVVSLSQSGDTDEIVATQSWASEQGACTVAVTNVADTRLALEADLAMVTAAGPERAVPATKTYLAQLAAIAVFADALGPRADALERELRRVPGQVSLLMEQRHGVDDAIAALLSAGHMFASGRGIAYGTALEVALKLEETSLVPVRGLSYADLRHGPIAVVDKAAVAVLIAAANGPLVTGMAQLAGELARLGARTIGIGGGQAFALECAVSVPGPDLPEKVAPLGLAVPAQLIVEGLARARGLDPDGPRGLTKVTQTDVELED